MFHLKCNILGLNVNIFIGDAVFWKCVHQFLLVIFYFFYLLIKMGCLWRLSLRELVWLLNTTRTYYEVFPATSWIFSCWCFSNSVNTNDLEFSVPFCDNPFMDVAIYQLWIKGPQWAKSTSPRSRKAN